ncbi:hypothetical protein N7476_001907 [Penicillium atrosanguineum]|uniref:Uncharacterized protein n=1 Tax=Penicillium atrosanguineum TaxID=1132637 RepID=A0A9W9Q4V7_9EURO|nr:hypothetical protein N7476_001907 [Penicillium atrosanguineum]
MLRNLRFIEEYEKDVLKRTPSWIVVVCSKITGDFRLSQETTAFKLIDQDGYEGGLATIGLSPDWVVLDDYTYEYTYIADEAGSRIADFKFSGYPTKNESMVVPNPKDIVRKGLSDILGLLMEMQATMIEIMVRQWVNGLSEDAAQAYSIPIFMPMQAVENINQAKNLGTQEKRGEKEEGKRKKDFILLIVSTNPNMQFVPIVGEELAAAAGLATIACSVAIAGELANGAFAGCDTVQDPKSAVVNVIEMLFGVGAIAKASRDGEGLVSIARFRRAMKAEEINGFGSTFKGSDDKLQAILKGCK